MNGFARTTSIGAELIPTSPTHPDLASLLEASPQGAFVLALAGDGTPAAVLVTGGCAFCGVGCAALCERLVPICEQCSRSLTERAVKTHGAGSPALKVIGAGILSDEQAQARVGVPVVFLSEDVWRPADDAVKQQQVDQVTSSLRPHLELLTDPAQAQPWIEAHADDTELVVSVLAFMISRASVLDEHASSARVLARHVRPVILRAKEVRESSGLDLGSIDIMLDLSV